MRILSLWLMHHLDFKLNEFGNVPLFNIYILSETCVNLKLEREIGREKEKVRVREIEKERKVNRKKR